MGVSMSVSICDYVMCMVSVCVSVSGLSCASVPLRARASVYVWECVLIRGKVDMWSGCVRVSV